MGRVIYNNKRIIPAPLLTISKRVERNADNQIGSTYQITLNGFIVADKGSPDSTGVFWDQSGYPPDEDIAEESRLKAITNKVQALQNLFNKDEDFKLLEIQSDDGSQPLTAYVKMIDISFNEDSSVWVNKCPYTINLEAYKISPIDDNINTDNIFSSLESWNLDLGEMQGPSKPYTYKLTHNISAVGVSSYASGVRIDAWENAKRYVTSRLGLGSGLWRTSTSGVMNVPDNYLAYSHTRSQTNDISAGNFGVVENWVISSGNYIEDFTVNTTSSDSNPFTSVRIEGNIRGLEERNDNFDITTRAYTNAVQAYNTIKDQIFENAKSYSEINDLNSRFLNKTITRNEIQGLISYSCEYDNRPSGILGAKSEQITIVDYLESDEFAEIPIIGRGNKGGVKQDMGASKSKRRSLTIEGIFKPEINYNDLRSLKYTPSGLDTIKDAVNPVTDGATVVFASQPQQTWSPNTGRFSYSIEWTYE